MPRLGVVGGHARVRHQQPLQLFRFAVLDDALLAGVALRDILIGGADGVVDGQGDGDAGGVLTGIVDAIAQDGDGQAGFVGIERDEGAEGIQRDVDRQAGILEIDLGEGEFAGESRALPDG